MRRPHTVATGAENVSQALSLTGFSVQGDSPAADNLTHKFLLRYYLFKLIIAYRFYIASKIFRRAQIRRFLFYIHVELDLLLIERVGERDCRLPFLFSLYRQRICRPLSLFPFAGNGLFILDLIFELQLFPACHGHGLLLSLCHTQL